MTSGSRYMALLVMLAALILPPAARAVTIEAGTYLFDNSKTRFTTVKLVAGATTDPASQVHEFAPTGELGIWSLTLTQPITGVGFCAFVSTTCPDGDYAMPVGVLLDSLYRNDPVFKRTLTQNYLQRCYNTTKWVFCPQSHENYTKGYWRRLTSYYATPSMTLPIVHIVTRDSLTVTTKEEYMEARLWIDNCDTTAFSNLGSESQPLLIGIKGRGNWSWNNSFKRPFKIRFADKQRPLGLDKSRHFVLQSQNDDYSGYLRYETGFEMSRALGMDYTPTQRPVELFFNGSYEGLYFLGEKIRVEGGRVDIFEQSDYETDPDNVTGGWLLELGYGSDPAVDRYENNNPAANHYKIFSRSPELLSPVQLRYIRDYFTRLDSLIYLPDKTDNSWETLLDPVSVARFYIIQELMENIEAFSGSLFMFKDLGSDEKLKFGPVWDFDNSYYQDITTADRFIFDYHRYYTFFWIEQMLRFPHFQAIVRSQWRKFRSEGGLERLVAHAWQWRDIIATAEKHDYTRWPDYASQHEPHKTQDFIDWITKKSLWLDEQWSNPADVNGDGTVNAADVTALYGVILGTDLTYLPAADVNGDGTVNAADVTALYNTILGL